MKAKLPVVIVVLVLVVAGILFFVLRRPAPAPAGPSLGEQLLDKVQNPVKGQVPEANPFTETETNPFFNVYQNPFE